ncbi:MAG: methyltransferase, partial [Synergistaceae bacterium]|nr:methyltransferase [Synergistaceae bacterium]
MLDASPEAIKCSKKNLSRFDLKHRAKLITDINQIEENNSELDLIISNPPYIPSHEIENLMPEVKNHEPILALDGGISGMDFYKLIFEQAEYILKNDDNKHTKNIILEAGDFEQVQKLKTLDKSFTFVNQILDTGNFPRALIFRKIK